MHSHMLFSYFFLQPFNHYRHKLSLIFTVMPKRQQWTNKSRRITASNYNDDGTFVTPGNASHLLYSYYYIHLQTQIVYNRKKSTFPLTSFTLNTALVLCKYLLYSYYLHHIASATSQKFHYNFHRRLSEKKNNYSTSVDVETFCSAAVLSPPRLSRLGRLQANIHFYCKWLMTMSTTENDKMTA